MRWITGLNNRFVARWKSDGGYGEFLTMAIPLILSTGMWSVQHFINRMFLTWYSPSAIAAAMPAGMLNFTAVSIFMGTVSYADVFIAQYYGAGKRNMIGPAAWQGMYVALLGATVIAALAPLARPVFNAIGHDLSFREDEIVYFQVLCLGAFPVLASTAMSAFYAGRGKTWPLVFVNGSGMLVNILLDYFLIFGNGPFPEMGIRGAAIASVCAAAFTFCFYLFLVSRKKYNEEYHTLKGWRPNLVLLARMLRFGVPSGVHFFLDIAGFTVFILIMGTLGAINLAATNIAFNISTLAFMPMIGSGIAVSVLVGQYLGKNRPELAERSAFSGFHLAFIYMASISLLYVLVPGLFLAPYASNADPQSFAAIRQLVMVLLRFVALYSLFDAMNIVFASAIKGAGDTHFVMRMIVVISVSVLVVPSYIFLVRFPQGLYAGWAIASAYVGALGISFLLRFLGGKWKTMRVIEHPVPFVPPQLPEIPSEEV